MTFQSELRKLMTDHGFVLVRDGHHLIWRNPKIGKTITTASTPSCPHAINNVRRSLRRYGSQRAA